MSEQSSSSGTSCVTTGGVNAAGSSATIASGSTQQACASEANAVITKFNALSSSQQTQILTFLRAL